MIAAKLLLALCLILQHGLLEPCYAQPNLKGYEAREFNGLNYRIWGDKGEAGGPYALVLYLHGAGERQSDNTRQIVESANVLDSLTAYLARTGKRSLVIAPQIPWPKKWVNTNWEFGSYLSDTCGFSAELDSVMSLIEDIRSSRSIIDTQIFAIGVSMGAFGVWDLLHQRPGLFKAAIPICGGADTTKARLMLGTRIWTFHGINDAIVPVRASREIARELRSLNARLIYTEYDAGHPIWSSVAKEGALFEWMFGIVDHIPSRSVDTTRTTITRSVLGDVLHLSGGEWTDARLSLFDDLGRLVLSQSIRRTAQGQVKIEMTSTSALLFYTLSTANGVLTGRVGESVK